MRVRAIPGLLTLYALHALRTADDIVHDALVDPRILELAGKQAKLIFAGKRGGRPSSEQGDINELLIERARMGRRVLRLKGGDPFVFGRGGEEALALTRAGLRFRIIPGITSGLAAAALAGIPATMRQTNHAVILAAGSRAADGTSIAEWEKLARTGQPIIVYMPMANLAEIMSAFERGGMASRYACRHHRFVDYFRRKHHRNASRERCRGRRKCKASPRLRS